MSPRNAADWPETMYCWGLQGWRDLANLDTASTTRRLRKALLGAFFTSRILYKPIELFLSARNLSNL